MTSNPLRLTLLAVGLVSISAWAQPSLAATATYFGRDNSIITMPTFPTAQGAYNSFVGALTSFGVENMENIDTSAGFSLNPTLTFGATGITATTAGVFATQPPFVGFSINSKSLPEAEGIGFPSENTTFTLSQTVNAFGLFIIQGGDGFANLTTFRLENTANPGVFVDVPLQMGPDWGSNNVFFFGMIDPTPFNKITILETYQPNQDMALVDADGMVYDNIVAGVPEPGSLALMALGGIFVAARTVRSRRA